MSKHLKQREAQYPKILFFIYGHTHQWESPWDVKLADGRVITIANSGAFQRTVDEDGFKRRVADRHLSSSEALKGITPEDLPACYSFVILTDGRISTLRWMQAENTSGHAVLPTAAECQ